MYLVLFLCFSFNFLFSVQFSHSVVSDSLQPHEPQHASPPCPSPTPAVHSNPCLLSRWCHPTISSSVIPFSSCPQSFPTSGSFPALRIMWPKDWSFSFNISLSNKYSGLISFRMDWLDLLAVQGTLKSLNTTVQKHQFFALSFLYKPLTKVIWFIYSQRRGSCLYQSSLAG